MCLVLCSIFLQLCYLLRPDEPLPASVPTSNENRLAGKFYQLPRNAKDIGRHSGTSPSLERQLQNILVLMIRLRLDVPGEPEVRAGGLQWEGAAERRSY